MEIIVELIVGFIKGVGIGIICILVFEGVRKLWNS